MTEHVPEQEGNDQGWIMSGPSQPTYEQVKSLEASRPDGVSRLYLAKLFLFSHGVRITDEARAQLPPTCRGDYPSTDGLQSRVTDSTTPDIPQYVTATENSESPFSLVFKDQKFYYRLGSDEFEAYIYHNREFRYILNEDGSVRILTEDEMQDKESELFKQSIHAGWLHLKRPRVSLIAGCADVCTYCPLWEMKYKVNPATALTKAIQESIDWGKAHDNEVTHALISGGTPKLADYTLFDDGVIDISKQAGTQVDLMCGAREDTAFLDRYAREGNFGRICINIEIIDDDHMTPDERHRARQLIPTKTKLGYEQRMKNIEHAAKIFGEKGVKVTSLIVVGSDLQPTDAVLRGVKQLAEMGVVPILSPYKSGGNVAGSHKKLQCKEPSPSELLYVYKETQKILKRVNEERGARGEKPFDFTMDHPGDQHNVLMFNEAIASAH